jgi:hypothetical protein
MSMISFMPWCRIDRDYDVGEVKIIPFRKDMPLQGLHDAEQDRLSTILATYRSIEDEPVDHAAILQFAGRDVTDELAEEERERIFEAAELACFSGLANRQYFNPLGPYCNSDCFAVYIQKFDLSGFSVIQTRRREGATFNVWPIDRVSVTVPVHCHTIRDVSLDETLLKALTGQRARCDEEEWGRWRNALTCFNLANSDSEGTRLHVEWVLLCSAFEHILGARAEARDVAERFCEQFTPKTGLLAQDARRRSERWMFAGRQLAYEWIREFYRIRGDFAHGRLQIRQPAVWKKLEHVVLATIAFPLLAKSLLQKAGVYALSNEDLVQIEAFEKLADTEDFLRPPIDQRGSLDSHWSRVRMECRHSLIIQRDVEEY